MMMSMDLRMRKTLVSFLSHLPLECKIHVPKRVRFIHYVETQLQFTIGHANLCKLQTENTETQNGYA